MALFRKKLNKALSQVYDAKRKDKSVIWQTPDGPAGEIDVKGIHRIIAAEKKAKKAAEARKKGPIGLIRRVSSPKAMKRLQKINQIKELRKQGYVVEKPVPKPKQSMYDKSVSHLLGNIPMGKQIVTISKRGNIRTGKLVFAEKGFVVIEIEGKQVPLRAERLQKIALEK
jgi:hypothetical protein